MQILKKITENEIIHHFLKSETESSRFKKMAERFFRTKGLTEEMLSKPNFKSRKENAVRKSVLASYRGYGKNKFLFKKFPKKVDWFKVSISKKEFSAVYYINDKRWVKLSGGTRLAREAVRNVKEGKGMNNLNPETIKEVAEMVARGHKFPTLIFVAESKKSRLVILEGHLRTTAFMYSHEHLPSRFEVYIGISPKMKDWFYY